MIVNILTKKKSPTPELTSLLADLSIYNRYASLDDYFKKHELTYKKEDLQFLITQLESYVIEVLKISAFAQFQKMVITRQWGSAGEEQARTSFLRCVLKLTPDVVVTMHHVSQFDSEMDKQLNELGLKSLSVAELDRLATQFQFHIVDKVYRGHQWQELTTLLQFLGSKKGLLVTAFGEEKQFIFGDVTLKRIGLHRATYFTQEDIRTPNIIVPKVAVSQDAEIFIRYEGLKCVFHQKWVPVFSSDEPWLFAMPERNISEGIKRKVLAYYEVGTPEDCVKIEKQFVTDMCETIVYHELGHIVSRHDVLTEEIAAVTEGTQVFSYSITMSLFELLADFAPQMKKIKGPLKNMVDISKKDVKRAEAMFYMYLSDVWFYDTYDEYMFIYSDLMVLALLRYINDDQSINFNKLEHDIYFKKTESDDQKDDSRFVNYLYHLLTKSIIRIQNYVKAVDFNVEGTRYSFDQMKAILEFQFVKNGSRHEAKDYFYTSSLWSFLFRTVEKFSSANQGLHTLLEEERNAIIKKFFTASAGKNAKKVWGDKHRDYIFSRMTEIGLLAKRDLSKPIDV